jgi:ribosomal protein S18 acetylase RimI-like enzyme
VSDAKSLAYRTIDPVADADLAVAAYLEACRISYGDDAAFVSRQKHLAWLAARVEEFPDGHVIATLDGRYVGQLELQVPYGLTTGYVNLFYVSEDFRGRGYGRKMHEYAERYFRGWEADRIELHVAPVNERAVGFYRALGYKAARREGRLWRMVKALAPLASDLSPSP